MVLLPVARHGARDGLGGLAADAEAEEIEPTVDGLADRRFAKLEVTLDEDRNVHVFSLQSVDFVAPEAVQGAGQ